ncbi:LOW QUALITY PROTEIN: secretoglobin family 3A member 1 [Physeter macrocephalus]|uniref:LOW QUALITY PROTEIN: secretoglobin family 3A member 1 n=1 Tax=Physeter macrocephalus TaxID=9755 RepID=A0A2Y9S071_PHYMC|nr:LOW QUALITY PROTEIN: secretoglobin family 3A member 1 [Physeter catodon]|eukprot:XP_023972036.2 LOW QUALITY PROTEIN: secretoglobin family 3A member 1 [Physeter catodon]
MAVAPAAAFFVNFIAKPVAPPSAAHSLTPAVEARAGAAANPFLKGFNPLKFILVSLGNPLEHLVEGSRKCVAELGPEVMGALKALLGALTFSGRAEAGLSQPGDKMLPSTGWGLAAQP